MGALESILGGASDDLVKPLESAEDNRDSLLENSEETIREIGVLLLDKDNPKTKEALMSVNEPVIISLIAKLTKTGRK